MRSAVPVLRWSRTASLLQNCLGRAKVALNCRLQNYFPISLFLIVSFFTLNFFLSIVCLLSLLFFASFFDFVSESAKRSSKSKRGCVYVTGAHILGPVSTLFILQTSTRDFQTSRYFLKRESERERKMYMRRREKEITPTPMRSNAVPTVHRKATKRWTQCPFPGKIWLFLPSLLALGIPNSLCVIDFLFYFIFSFPALSIMFHGCQNVHVAKVYFV